MCEVVHVCTGRAGLEITVVRERGRGGERERERERGRGRERERERERGGMRIVYTWYGERRDEERARKQRSLRGASA